MEQNLILYFSPDLSSFYIFDRLLEYLKHLPTTNCYCRSRLYENAVSGCGFILSPDVAHLMINNKEHLIKSHQADDDAIAELMRSIGIPAIFHPRQDYNILKTDWTPDAIIPDTILQVRVKNYIPELRHTDDMLVYKWLLEKFYHINLNLNK